MLLFDVSVVVFFIILSHVPFENRFFVSDHGSIVILPGILFLCVFFFFSLDSLIEMFFAIHTHTRIIFDLDVGHG